MNNHFSQDIECISRIVFGKWEETFIGYGNIIKVVKCGVYNNYIRWIDMQNCSLQEKCRQLSEKYCEEIKRCVILYKKEDLLIGLICIKEFITKNKTKWKNRLSHIEDEMDCVNQLIYFVYNLAETEFKNNDIDTEFGEDLSYVSDIFIWGRQLALLEANMERYKIAEKKKASLEDMAFHTIEDNIFYNYYEEFKRQGGYERFEDYEIKDINIQKQTERLKIMPDQIILNVDLIIEKKFGFHLMSLREFSQVIFEIYFRTKEDWIKYIEDNSIIWNCIGFPKSIFYNIGTIIHIRKNELDRILETFSLKEKSVQEIELSCFYVTEDMVYFGPCDLVQIFSMFEKFSLSGYFLDHFKKGIDFIKLFNPYQRKTAAYMCYVLADILIKEGYKMHMEKFKYKNQVYCSPRAEIDNIPNGKENILKNLGDIDVLFLDEYRKQIVCVEYKYFQPSMTYNQLTTSDRNKLKKQVYEKSKQIEGRENAIKKNIKCVIEFLKGKKRNNSEMDGNEAEYNVKTIIVLSRPNMYVFSKEIKKEIKYEIMVMTEFYEKAKSYNL